MGRRVRYLSAACCGTIGPTNSNLSRIILVIKMEGEEAILESVARGGPASTSGRSHLRKRIAFAREEGAREWHRLGNAVVRGAAVGMCLKGGLNVLSWVLALLSPSRRRYLLASPFRTLFEQILETLRYTLFLASLSGTYVGADESIAVFFGRKR